MSIYSPLNLLPFVLFYLMRNKTNAIVIIVPIFSSFAFIPVGMSASMSIPFGMLFSILLALYCGYKIKAGLIIRRTGKLSAFFLFITCYAILVGLVNSYPMSQFFLQSLNFAGHIAIMILFILLDSYDIDFDFVALNVTSIVIGIALFGIVMFYLFGIVVDMGSSGWVGGQVYPDVKRTFWPGIEVYRTSCNLDYILPLSFYFIWRRWNKNYIKLSAVLSILFVAIYLTGSKSSIALFLLMVLYIFVANRISPIVFTGIIWVATISLYVYSTIFLTFDNTSVLYRFIEPIELFSQVTMKELIVGKGIGSFFSVQNPLFPKYLWINKVQFPHMFYLGILFKLGLLGLLWYFMAFIGINRSMVSIRKKLPEDQLKAIKLLVTCVYLLFFVSAFFYPILVSSMYTFVLLLTFRHLTIIARKEV